MKESAEPTLKPNDRGSYTTLFTSSSDEECDDNFGPKLATKRILFNKPSTSSIDSKIEIEEQSRKTDEAEVRIETTTDSIEDYENLENPNSESNLFMDVDSKSCQDDVFVDVKQSDDDIAKRIQKKKKRKQNKRNVSLPPEIAGDRTLMKYWVKRYRLFSKFDEGIKLDRGELVLLN